MNQRTAKLLRRYAAAVGGEPRRLRREWQRVPQGGRAFLRQSMIATVKADRAAV